MRFAAILFMITLLHTSICRAEGLGGLIEVARSQADIQKEYVSETKRFDAVRKGIKTGSIRKGQSKDEIVRLYGEPVIIIPEKGGDKWVYKPANSDYFGGTKAYLFFSEENMLNEARVESRQEEKE